MFIDLLFVNKIIFSIFFTIFLNIFLNFKINFLQKESFFPVLLLHLNKLFGRKILTNSLIDVSVTLNI